MKRSNIRGIMAVGAGAIIGCVVGMPFLARKNTVGLLLPLLGAITAGLICRVRAAERRATGARPDAEPDQDVTAADATTDGPAGDASPASNLGTAVAFLLVGPVVGLVISLLIGEPPGTPHFTALITLGTFVGFAGCVGSLFLSR